MHFMLAYNSIAMWSVYKIVILLSHCWSIEMVFIYVLLIPALVLRSYDCGEYVKRKFNFSEMLDCQYIFKGYVIEYFLQMFRKRCFHEKIIWSINILIRLSIHYVIIFKGYVIELLNIKHFFKMFRKCCFCEIIYEVLIF